MANFVDVSSGPEPVRSRDMTIVALYCALAVAACFVLALYLGPANDVPVDPAAIGFFP